MDKLQKPSRSLVKIAGNVAIATLISKLFGLVRQQAIAAAFGVGAVVDAYNYAYVIPGFLLVLLGGINGPFHSAIASVLSRRDRTEAASIVETVTTLVSGLLLLVTVGLRGCFKSTANRQYTTVVSPTLPFKLIRLAVLYKQCLIIFAEPLIDLVAPGLNQIPQGLETRAIAI